MKELFLKEMGVEPPLPGRGVVVVAEEEGEIVGFGVMQKVVHFEPFWVSPKYRGKSVFRLMLAKLVELFDPCEPGALCTTEDYRVAKLIEHIGLEEMRTWRVFRWVRR